MDAACGNLISPFQGFWRLVSRGVAPGFYMTPLRGFKSDQPENGERQAA
jgi:hypothetical protein